MLLILSIALPVGANTAFAATNITNTTSNHTTTNVANVTNTSANQSTVNTPQAAGSPTSQVSFTSAQINSASSKLQTFVATNNRLPDYVTVGTQQVSMPQFLQLVTDNLLNLAKGLQNTVALKNVNNPSSATESVQTGNIYTTEYLALAQSAKSTIDSTGTAPGCINSSLGKIRFENLVYTFSKILNYQATNNRLPNYVSTKSWTGTTSTGTTPVVNNSPTTPVPEGPTQTGSTVSFTKSQINDAASRVNSFVGTNHQLPNYVTIGTQQVSMPQFLQLLVKNLININSGLVTSATTGNIAGPSNMAETIKSGNLYQSEYISLANTIKTALDTGTAPGYVNSSLGQIRFENLIYIFGKITNYQTTNSRLPNYVSISAWTTATEGSSVQAILDSIGYAEAKFRDIQGQSSPTVMEQVGYGDCWADSGWLYNKLSAAGIAVRIMGTTSGGAYYLHRWAEINIGNGWQTWNYAKYSSQHYGALGSGIFVVKSSV